MKNMTVKHTLNDELMMGYAAGILPEAFNLVVATHLSLCDESRAGVESYEAVGGAVLESTETAKMSSGALADCLKRIKTEQPEVAKAKPSEGVFPNPLQAYVGGDLDAVKWRSLGNGTKQAILPTAKGATARLLFIPAGTAVPDHGHHGTELTLVLQGAFADEVDRFGRGDIEIANEDLNHQPIAEMGEDCICLAATDAPLRFNSLLPRLMQPLFRI